MDGAGRSWSFFGHWELVIGHSPLVSPNSAIVDTFGMPNFQITHLNEVPPVKCPCGFARRAFAGSTENAASVHVVDIQRDSRTHYHKRMTEIYLVLEGEGQMELDGNLFPVKPMTAIYIKPGCRHRAIGKLKIVNIPIPSFDEADEWFD